MRDAFYIYYAYHQDSAASKDSSEAEQHLSCEPQPCIDRLCNLLSSMEASSVVFSVVYACSGRPVGNPKAELSVTSIAKSLGLAAHEGSRAGMGYMLLDNSDTTISVTPFVSWGTAPSETLK